MTVLSQKKVTIKEKSYPWITYNIRIMMRHRDKAHREARSSKSPTKLGYYKELKKLVAQSINAEKEAYLKKYICSNIQNPRIMWKHIKENINFKNTDVPLPLNLQDTEKLNMHFMNVPGDNIVDSSYIDYYLKNKYDSSSTFGLHVVTEGDVARTVREVHYNAVGVDGISLDMLLLSIPYTLNQLSK